MNSAYKLNRVTVYTLDLFLSQFWTSPLLTSGSNYCFLTGIQVSQEIYKVVWYFHLFQNFPVVRHTVKNFSIVTEVEVNVFLELPCFFYDTMEVGILAIWSLVPLPFLNLACTSASSQFLYCLKDFEHYLASTWNKHNCMVFGTFFGIAFLWDSNENWTFPEWYSLQEERHGGNLSVHQQMKG